MSWNTREFETVLAELETLDAAGINIVQGLRACAERVRSQKMKRELQCLIKALESGLSLSKALYQCDIHLDPVVKVLLVAGEKSGKLGNALVQAVRYLGLRRTIAEAVFGLCIYPAAVLSLGTIVSLFIAFYLLPHQMHEIEHLHEESWRYSQLVQSQMRVAAMLFFARIVAVAFTVLWLCYLALVGVALVKPRSMVIHRLLFAIPGIRAVIRRYQLFHFASALDLLLSHSVPIDEALLCVAASKEAPLAAQAAYNALGAAELGMPLSAGMGGPPRIISFDELWLLREAEKREQLPQFFHNLTERVVRELEQLPTLIQRFEPIIVAILGIWVALAAVSVFLPTAKWFEFVRLGE
jgi:general secretion pathway protein F